ncbi:MAG: hypothetical protein CMJ83_05110 [Planctomycetes bacterium]|nr:hypothetical protein [Planctomycetota bacterium]
MKNVTWSLLVLALALPMLGGCASGEHDGDTAAAYMLCGGCGQVKHTEACCAEGAAACAKCGLHAGSPGCCKMSKGTDVALCSGCGHATGAESCCAEGSTKCGKCGLAAGSLGCCKLPKK